MLRFLSHFRFSNKKDILSKLSVNLKQKNTLNQSKQLPQQPKIQLKKQYFNMDHFYLLKRISPFALFYLGIRIGGNQYPIFQQIFIFAINFLLYSQNRKSIYFSKYINDDNQGKILKAKLQQLDMLNNFQLGTFIGLFGLRMVADNLIYCSATCFVLNLFYLVYCDQKIYANLNNNKDFIENRIISRMIIKIVILISFVWIQKMSENAVMSKHKQAILNEINDQIQNVDDQQEQDENKQVKQNKIGNQKI